MIIAHFIFICYSSDDHLVYMLEAGKDRKPGDLWTQCYH